MTEIAQDGRMIVHGQSKELHEFGMANGMPPMAVRRLLVDFDSTIAKWGPLMGKKTPTSGAINALLTLVDRGYTLTVFTSRMSKEWARSVVGDDPVAVDEFLAGQYEFVWKVMREFGIPFKGITAEKIPAHAYIDDKAIGFRDNWQEVLNDPLLA